MLKTKRMTRVSIAGPRTVMKDVISCLHDLEILHIKDYTKRDDSPDFDIGSPLPESDRISRALVKLRSINSNIPQKKTKSGRKEDIMSVEKNVEMLEKEVVEKIERLKSIGDEQAKLEAHKNELLLISCLHLKLDVFKEYETLKHFTGYVADTKFEKKIKDSNAAEKCIVYAGEHGKKYVTAIFVQKENADAVLSILGESGFSEINTANFIGMSGTPEKMIKEIDSKIAALEENKAKARKDLEGISDKWGSYIKFNEESLAEQSEKSEAPLRFAVSENAFIANGWVPADKADMMEEELKEVTRGKIFVQTHENVGDAPIALDNIWPSKSFGLFMNMYSLPSYKEIDPTFFMFLAFPVFFGFMLGDWGYGLLTLLIFAALRIKAPKLKDVLNVMIIASISTIIFGLLYDEFFGLELFHKYGIVFPHLLTRTESEGASQLILYALVLGVIHISAGYVVGFINELKMHGIKAAVLEKMSWLVYMAGFFPSLIAFFNMGNYIPQYRYILLAIGIIMIIAGEGIKGALELISPLTNVLSYARLMAVGLASVILAEVVNEMTGPMFASGALGFVIGATILVLGHGINIGLGLMSPFIHSMRLHYVEFFLKFYHGGGKKYTPFGLKEKISNTDI